MIPILVMLHIVVIVCILWIWGGRFAIIPVLWLLWLVWSSWVQESTNTLSIDSLHEFAQRHAMTIARLCMMLWVWWVARARSWTILEVLLWVVATNVVMRWVSHIRKYDVWRSMFQIWFVVSLVMLLIHGLQEVSLYTRVHILLICVAFMSGVWSFFVFVIPSLHGTSYRRDQYISFILLNCVFLIRIYARWRDDLPSAVVLAQMYLMMLYCLIYAVYRYTDHMSLSSTKNEDLVEKILSGHNILDRIHKKTPTLLLQIRDFLLSLDVRTQTIIWSLNICIILLQVFVFAKWIDLNNILMSQILLWFGIVAFFVNYLLLRTIWFWHHLQRVLAFVLITGGIYLTIIQVYGNDAFMKLTLGVIWTVWNSLSLLIVPHSQMWTLLRIDDYKSRIISLWWSSIVNIIFLFQLWYHMQFSFSLMLLYIAMQTFLILYAWGNHIYPSLIEHTK